MPHVVLHRNRRIEDSRIDQCTRSLRDPLVGRVGIHLCKELPFQLILLLWMAEIWDGGLIGVAVVAQFKPG